MEIGLKIKKLRLEKKIFQTELDNLCRLPKSTIAKIESGRRTVSALELSQIAESLGVSLGCFFRSDSVAVTSEERVVIEALRQIDFDKYKRMMKSLEATIYFKAKAEKSEKKTKLKEMVIKLSQLREQDLRPRINKN